MGRKHQFVEVASGLQRVFDSSTPTERPVQRHKQSVALASDECPLQRPRKNTVTKTERPHPAFKSRSFSRIRRPLLAESTIPLASPKAVIGLVADFSECLKSRALPNSHSRSVPAFVQPTQSRRSTSHHLSCCSSLCLSRFRSTSAIEFSWSAGAGSLPLIR